MTEEEWFSFITTGKPPIISVTRLASELCQTIKATTNLVQIRHDYALKTLSHHNVLPHHFRHLTWGIERGRAISDRQKHLTFFWLDSYAGWFHITIKTNERRDELWVSTFHKTTESKTRGKLKKHVILREFIT
jgi:hypothetical protein